MTVTQVRARHKVEKATLSEAQKVEKKNLDNVWKGELKTIQLQKKEALTRLTTGSGWKQKTATQKSAERGAFIRSYASNIADVKANAKTAKASLSAKHKAAKANMSARHKSELAALRK
ncbi:MAG: hypothetical protein QQW96_03850 [Tychonema bourrellyi B0820]|nr:hypothetical protein [Tychonema bourrellyi B0820]PJE45229.1 MAG: hypothetical protein CUR32_01105 [Flavobacterium sp.] [Flavobacterium sp. FEMGT703F]